MITVLSVVHKLTLVTEKCMQDQSSYIFQLTPNQIKAFFTNEDAKDRREYSGNQVHKTAKKVSSRKTQPILVHEKFPMRKREGYRVIINILQ